MRTVRVRASVNYDIHIGAGLLDRAGEYIYRAAGGEIAAIVTDDIVANIHLDRLRTSLRRVGYDTAVFTFRNGESSKNIFTYGRILEFLAENRLTRSDVAIALGGGVVGDLTGFAAATYMRGIPYIQMPTTLLAAIDSSIGGKTAVDLDAGKNLAGAFHHPKLVLCEMPLIERLPPRIMLEGVAEIIKIAMITDEEMFHMLSGQSRTELEEIIARCVKIKRDIVCEDEFDTGTRKLLSFGHTVGHAIEQLSNYQMSHGHAVAIGMTIETLSAVRIGMCDQGCYDELVDLLHKIGLPYKSPYSADKVAHAILSDKKRKGDKITLSLPRRIGKCILCDVEVEKYRQLLNSR